MSRRRFFLLILMVVSFTGCVASPNPDFNSVTPIGMSSLTISSPSFPHNGQIPMQYTCDGDDINPPLTISGVPDKAKSLVLVVDDPDAPMGTWDHWIVWNIDPKTTEISEDHILQSAVFGMNDFGKLEYGGPCPPKGKPHRYFFKLYALDTMLDLEEGASKDIVERAIQGHVLDKAELIGIYQR